MIPVIPWYITVAVLAVSLLVALAVWRLFALATEHSGLPPADRRRVRVAIGLFLATWLGAALALAPAPASVLGRDPFRITLLVPLFAVASFAGVFLAFRISGVFRRVLEAASLPALHAVQIYRVLGVVFVILLAQGQLPAHFALPAGWGDIAIGLTAPLVALALVRRVPGAIPLAISWNVLGLLDLIVAVGMATGLLAPLLAPELGPRVPAAAAMGVFPMVLVPLFGVPVAVLLHVLALGRLLRERRPRARLVPRPAR
ncbi:MAG TPA: hypothetical protein VFG66_05055 [Gemmatimonadales bacterium]|nr:hypothetical protein [Gemmatimonadales bacterium]